MRRKQKYTHRKNGETPSREIENFEQALLALPQYGGGGVVAAKHPMTTPERRYGLDFVADKLGESSRRSELLEFLRNLVVTRVFENSMNERIHHLSRMVDLAPTILYHRCEVARGGVSENSDKVEVIIAKRRRPFRHECNCDIECSRIFIRNVVDEVEVVRCDETLGRSGISEQYPTVDNRASNANV